MSNKMQLLVVAIITLCSVMMVDSCKNTNNNVTPTVSFSTGIIPILTSKCALNSNCHLGANSLNLGTNFDSASAYNTIITKELVSTSNPSSSLLYVEVNTGAMPKPPAAPLSASDQALILAWIQQGAKNN